MHNKKTEEECAAGPLDALNLLGNNPPNLLVEWAGEHHLYYFHYYTILTRRKLRKVLEPPCRSCRPLGHIHHTHGLI